MGDHIIGGDRISSTNPLSVSVAAGGGGAATIADGADATQGAVADAVVAAGAAGTLSAKLRRLTTDLAALLGLFPAAAASSDTRTAPTTTDVYAWTMLWTTSVGQRLRNANSAGDGGTAGIAASGLFLYNGASWDRTRTPNVFKVVALTAGTAETTIWTPTSGKKFRLMGFLLTPGAASTLTFKDNTSGTTIFAARAATDTPIAPGGLGNGILSAAANNVLTVTRGTSATLDGAVWGTEE